MEIVSSAPRARFAVALLALTAGVAAARAEPVRDVRSLDEDPIAPLGGVMMLPLGARAPGNAWPAQLDVTLADGTSIEGVVAWMHPHRPDPVAARRWTDDPRGLGVRAIAPDDDTSLVGRGAPYLLVRLPARGTGPIRLGEQTLRAQWCDPGASYTFTPLPGLDRPRLGITAAPDRPSPTSPFEYWRWVLLADQLDHRPPATDVYGPIGALVAEHQANLWRIGLSRVAEGSIKVATTCRDMLTRLCTDRPYRFAAWVSDPTGLNELLATTLDLGRPPDALVRDAAAWAQTRNQLLCWAESEHGDRARLSLVNRGELPLVARIAWEGTGAAPVTVELPPGELTRATISRPPAETRLVAAEEPLYRVITVRAGRQTLRLMIGRGRSMVRPPGLVLPPFRPPLTLAELDIQRVREVDAGHVTNAQIRKMRGRWEVFFDCRRAPGGGAGEAGEAITLFIGPDGAARATLRVTEGGGPEVLAGADDGTLEVHRRSYDDRWYARIVLPDAWLRGPEDLDADPWLLLIGARRTHAGGDAVETSPSTSAPWRHAPSRAGVDLRAWDDYTK